MTEHEKVHRLQEQFLNDDVNREERRAFHQSWFDETTADYWRHQRMYEAIRPLAEGYREGTWLTVGDGRYGLDSYRLNRLFGIDAFPTDISEGALKIAAEKGVISRYGVENAELLSFADRSFEVVFCKESFHHFPRPIIALYEMIRVASKAVVLIEPNDRNVLVSPRVLVRQAVRMAYNRLFPHSTRFDRNYRFFADYGNMFEPSGNYLYALSRRELEKVVQGINLYGMAWLGMNDHYVKGCEFVPAKDDNEIFREIRDTIRRKDEKCLKSPLFHEPGLLIAILFREQVEPVLRTAMEKSGYLFADTRRNPHLK